MSWVWIFHSMKTSYSFNAEQRKKSESGTVWVSWWPGGSQTNLQCPGFTYLISCHLFTVTTKAWMPENSLEKQKRLLGILKLQGNIKRGDEGLKKSRLAWLHLTILTQISTEFFKRDGWRKSGWNSFLAVLICFQLSKEATLSGLNTTFKFSIWHRFY